MTGLHESTLALSVYNFLQRAGNVTREQALTGLQKAWMPELEATEVSDGARYLLERKLVTEADGVLAARVLHNGSAATVVRNPADQTELMVVVPRKAS